MITVRSGGTLIYTVTFTDEEGNAIQPATVAWTLTNSSGTVINGRSAVAETPGLEVNIILSGADTTATADSRRKLLITGTYDSDLSVANLPFAHEELFDIAP